MEIAARLEQLAEQASRIVQSLAAAQRMLADNRPSFAHRLRNLEVEAFRLSTDLRNLADSVTT